MIEIHLGLLIFFLVIWSIFLFWVAYHLGQNDVIAPYWIALIGEMLENEDDRRYGEPLLDQPEWRPIDKSEPPKAPPTSDRTE